MKGNKQVWLIAILLLLCALFGGFILGFVFHRSTSSDSWNVKLDSLDRQIRFYQNELIQVNEQRDSLQQQLLQIPAPDTNIINNKINVKYDELYEIVHNHTLDTDLQYFNEWTSKF